MSSLDYPTLVNLTVNGTPVEAADNRKILEKALEDEPSVYFNQLLTIASESTDVKIRIFCYSNLGKGFSFFNLPKSGYNSLKKDDIAKLKSVVFDLIDKETETDAKYEVATFIGVMAASIISDEKNGKAKAWPEFTIKTLELVQSDDVNKKIGGNLILAFYFDHSQEDYTTLATEVKNFVNRALSHSNNLLVLSGVELLRGFVGSIEPKDTKQFNEFSSRILAHFVTLYEKEDPVRERFLEAITEYSSEQPKLFETALRDFNTKAKSVLDSKKATQEAKLAILELTITLNIQHPKKLEKSLKEILSLVMQYFIDNITEPDDEWNNPSSTAEALEPTFKKSVEYFDSLLSGVDPQVTLPVLKTQLQEAYKNKDWKKKAAALACLSQIGEYCEDLTAVNQIIQTSLLLLEDEHPKVRYTVLHLLGQLAEDRPEEFAETYHHVIGDISKRLNDPNPRVLSHVYACLTNIVENCDEKNVQPFVSKVVPAALKSIKEGSVSIVESAIPVIAAFSEGAKSGIAPYAKEIFTTLVNIYDTKTEDTYTQTRAEVLECLSLICENVKKEEAKEISDKVWEYLYERFSQLAQGTIGLPWKTYCFACIPRLVQVFEGEISSNIEKVLPDLLKIRATVLADFNRLRDALEKQDETKADLSEEITLLLVCFENIAKFYPTLLLPHFEDVSHFVTSFLTDAVDNIAESAVDCLFPLFEVIYKHGTDETQKFNVLNSYLKELTNLLAKEGEPRLIEVTAENLAEIVELAGLMLKEQGVEELFGKVLAAMKSSFEYIQENLNSKPTGGKGDDDEDDEEEELPFDEEAEWQAQKSLCQILGKLYKSQPHACILRAKEVFQNVIPQYIKIQNADQACLIGVYMTVDLVEHMGYNYIKNEFPQIVEGLTFFATKNSNEIRQAALFGLGLVAKTCGDAFKTFGASVITAVINGIENKNGEDDPCKDSARDNGISALGKILKYQAGTITDLKKMFAMFVQYLPLKSDTVEGVETYEFLVDCILGENATYVFGADGSKMTKVFTMLADNLDTEFTNDAVKEKVRTMLKVMLGNESTAEVCNKTIKKLSKVQQEKLNALRPN